ncbi:DUF2798 domain-containing protein [Methanosphaera sp. BMS]|uniref:DUF2798 domain-containing protein n=1 Tax=Methanosphaera sp. BMS TaxID=1789762 RepID=UPI000DC1D7E6|nr:DUF2798 domain-containing protein [Methanosphaera sp. BMS]AWX31826.1 hypothetical protein AW729_01400 [Methanosphaera sp. BMS]
MTELKCKECGSTDIVQEGTQYLCQACGTNFSDENLNQDEVEATNNQTPQQYDGTTQQYGAEQQNTYNQQQVPAKRKSMIISMILSVILVGFGLVYLGFIKRWLVALVISIVLSILFLPLGFIWFLYMLYDTYACTNAINNAQVLPKLAGFIDMD